VTLKSGEVLQGKVLRESPDEVVLEYRFSSTIMDERAIARSEIAKVERETPDVKAYQALAVRQTPPTALDESAYQETLDKLQSFLKDYAYSPHTREVRAKMAEAEAEKKRLANGELKVEGRWINASQLKEESYQVDARRAVEAMKDQVARGNLVAALNQFAEIEKNWPLSAAWPDAVESARVILKKLDQVLTHQLRNFPIQEEQRRIAFERVPVEQRAQIEAAQKKELDAATAAVEASKASSKYAQYSTLVQSSMTGLQSTVRSDLQRLGEIDLKPLKQGVAEAQAAARQLEQKQLALAETSLKNAEAAWPQMELLPRLKNGLQEARSAVQAGNEAQSQAVQEAADFKKKEAEAQSKQP